MALRFLDAQVRLVLVERDVQNTSSCWVRPGRKGAWFTHQPDLKDIFALPDLELQNTSSTPGEQHLDGTKLEP